MFSFLFAPASSWLVEVGLCIIRIVVGVVTVYFGFPNLLGGPTMWITIGKRAGLIGIHFLPIVWGLLSACVQAFGGLALIMGFGTRIFCVPLAIMMVIAILYHLDKGEGFGNYALALILLAVYVASLFIGSGKISLDYYLWRKSVHPTEYHPLMNRPEDYL